MTNPPRVVQVEVVDSAESVLCERAGCSRPARYRLAFADGARLLLCATHAAGVPTSRPEPPATK